MKNIGWMGLLCVSLLVGCGGGSDGGPASDNAALSVVQISSALSSMPMESLNPSETNSLSFMREEEKLALDVYTAMDQLYAGNTRVFSNVASSEITHIEAVRLLLDRYSLNDPALGSGAGVFVDQTLQVLYARLLQSGQSNLSNAFMVGVEIEELDLHDLQSELLGVDNQDIRYVYEILMKGSRNHLRSFYKNLLQQGGSYVPQYIPQADFDAIVNTPTER